MMRRILSALAILVASLAASAGPGHGDRVLRDVLGEVRALQEAVDADGTVWLEVTLATRDGETLEARVAPVEVLAATGFRFEVGDAARVRLFVDEHPPGVSRIRNLSTGQTLRLRCLRGEPIWNLRDPAGTPGGPPGAGHRGRHGAG